MQGERLSHEIDFVEVGLKLSESLGDDELDDLICFGKGVDVEELSALLHF